MERGAQEMNKTSVVRGLRKEEDICSGVAEDRSRCDRNYMPMEPTQAETQTHPLGGEEATKFYTIGLIFTTWKTDAIPTGREFVRVPASRLYLVGFSGTTTHL